MLYRNTVKPELLELLTSISNDNFFSNFSLAGGTALALQIGHRISTDLDFFSENEFNNDYIITHLLSLNYKIVIFKNTHKILQLSVNDIKVDFLHLNYPLISDTTILENIKLYSIQDIAAMKLNAITNRGTKKDFYDVFFILNYFSLTEMIQFFRQKFIHTEIFSLVKSLNYFYDAEIDADPILIKKTSWKKVKEKLSKEILEINFSNLNT